MEIPNLQLGSEQDLKFGPSTQHPQDIFHSEYNWQESEQQEDCAFHLPQCKVLQGVAYEFSTIKHSGIHMYYTLQKVVSETNASTE